MKAFIAAHGQPDNLGDSVLRRAMLDTFIDPRIERHVLVGMNSGDFAAGLGLRPEDHVYESRSRWQRAALRAALAGPIAFVTNAGEVQLNRRRTKIALADIPTVAVVRARGGRVVQTGMGFRTPEGRYPWQIALVSRASGIATWRDEPSRRYARFGAVAPDWAFALPASGAPASGRDLLAVTMRGDRPAPTDAFVQSVRQVSEEWGLRPVVVNQVVRDLARSRELASSLDAEFLEPWEGGPHAEFEARIRDVYARSAVVVSDRLHALVLGFTEGAVPVGATQGSPEKLDRTFAGAGISGVSFDATALSREAMVERMRAIVGRRDELLATCASAREQLLSLSARTRAYVLRR